MSEAHLSRSVLCHTFPCFLFQSHQDTHGFYREFLYFPSAFVHRLFDPWISQLLLAELLLPFKAQFKWHLFLLILETFSFWFFGISVTLFWTSTVTTIIFCLCTWIHVYTSLPLLPFWPPLDQGASGLSWGSQMLPEQRSKLPCCPAHGLQFTHCVSWPTENLHHGFPPSVAHTDMVLSHFSVSMEAPAPCPSCFLQSLELASVQGSSGESSINFFLFPKRQLKILP